MDYRNALLSSYYTNLNGSIIVNGSEIEVGTKISKDARNFIRYYISSDSDIGTFDETIREIDVNLDCVSIQPKNRGDDSIVDEMVDQVKEYIDKIYVDGWTVALTLDMGTEDESGESDVSYIVRRTITFKHFIDKQ